MLWIKKNRQLRDLQSYKILRSNHQNNKYLLSFADMAPRANNLALLPANTLHASLAKSRSRTSPGETGISANASLSSLTGAQPTCRRVDAEFISEKKIEFV